MYVSGFERQREVDQATRFELDSCNIRARAVEENGNVPSFQQDLWASLCFACFDVLVWLFFY